MQVSINLFTLKLLQLLYSNVSRGLELFDVFCDELKGEKLKTL
jgi:hypothetical protein